MGMTRVVRVGEKLVTEVENGSIFSGEQEKKKRRWIEERLWRCGLMRLLVMFVVHLIGI